MAKGKRVVPDFMLDDPDDSFMFLMPLSLKPDRDNFTREERLNALADFYKGPGAKYPKAAEDFFKQHPGLK